MVLGIGRGAAEQRDRERGRHQEVHGRSFVLCGARHRPADGLFVLEIVGEACLRWRTSCRGVGSRFGSLANRRRVRRKLRVGQFPERVRNLHADDQDVVDGPVAGAERQKSRFVMGLAG